jgi:hypothetical protein
MQLFASEADDCLTTNKFDIMQWYGNYKSIPRLSRLFPNLDETLSRLDYYLNKTTKGNISTLFQIHCQMSNDNYNHCQTMILK